MIRAIIVDDERPSCNDLEKLLRESGMARVEGSFTEPAEALAYLKENTADAVFLDIEMPEIDGIELAHRIIEIQGKIAVVFVTAYNQYAVEAFRLNALDYLMKPVEEKRLRETLDRIVEEKNIPLGLGRVRVRCFGKFAVETETGAVKFRTEKAEELFALLLDQRGGFISRSRIIDCLWEDYDGERAVVHFNTTLYNVKKALLLQGITNTIEYDRGNYRLDAKGLDCDYIKFYELVSADTAITDANYPAYEAAAGLYTGEYLSGKDFVWMERNRQGLRERYVGLLLRLGEYCGEKGRYDKTAEWMKTGLMHEPLHRDLNYRLIEALLLAGDKISAIRYYQIYENGFRLKVKQEPDAAFKRLLRRASEA